MSAVMNMMSSDPIVDVAIDKLGKERSARPKPERELHGEYQKSNKMVLVKIKIKSLAEESRIIRKEIKKCPQHRPWLLSSMQHHRKHIVQPALREAYVAYGLARGRSYFQIENKAYDYINWTKVKALLEKYRCDWSKEEIAELITKVSTEANKATEEHIRTLNSKK